MREIAFVRGHAGMCHRVGAVGAVLACALPVLACTLVFCGAPASAELTHFYTAQSFGPEGRTGARTFVTPQSIAVDQSTDDVYVYDDGFAEGSVYKFSASGEKANFSALGANAIEKVGTHGTDEVEIAVDNSSGPAKGDIYVANGLEVRIYNAAGELKGALKATVGAPWGEPCGVAVDPAGNVYVGLYSEHVNKYTPVANPVSNANYVASLSGLSGICNIAADAEENVYADSWPAGPVVKYEQSQLSPLEVPAIGTQVDAAGSTLAADPQSHDLFIDETEALADYESLGAATLLGASGVGGPGALSGSYGVAVDHASGELYAANGAGRVEIFGPAVTAAEAIAQAASGVAQATATLNGAVNPAGLPVSACQFEYRGAAEASFTHTTPCVPPPGSGEALLPVAAELSGLEPATSYSYRLVASNANGANYSREETFTTAPAVEGVSTGPAEELTPSTAKLTGSLAPEGTDAHYYFQYGTSSAYGSTSPPPPGVDAGAGVEPVPAETTLAGLEANTVYHYRLVATDKFGATDGADATFTTPGPPTVLSESSEVISTEKFGQTNATLQGQVNPGGFASTYRFEYGETTAYGTNTPIPDGEIGSGEEPVSLPAATLSGLKVASTYHYRVVASNSQGTVHGPDRQFTTVAGALIDAFATEVVSTSATLNAQINPLGSHTHYYFQYGVSTAYASSGPNPPVADVGAGESSRAVSLRLQSLQPSTVYHYRVLAENSLGVVASADQTFTTQAASGEFALPDGRVWELVSPANKNGALIEPIGEGLLQASEDGGAIAYLSRAPIGADPMGNAQQAQILSVRGAQGWSSQDIATPHDAITGQTSGKGQEYRFFSADLSLELVAPFGETPLSSTATEKTIYLRENAGCAATPPRCYAPLVSPADVRPGAKFGQGITFVSATPDLSHVILSSEAPLLPLTAEGALYEWAAGRLTPVSLLPGSAQATRAFLGDANQNVRHAISSDATRIVWGTHEPGLGNHLYMRDTARRETIQLDAAQGAPEPEQGGAKFELASSDGSKVLFTDAMALTADSTADRGLAGDLYECEMIELASGRLACRLIDLTVDQQHHESAHVLGGLPGSSEDGSYVYFVAEGVLAAGATSNAQNLYVLHQGGGGRSIAFIATLSSDDGPDWSAVSGGSDLGQMTTRVSANGRYLAFMSDRSLTGYDNLDANSDQPDEEVYLYDATQPTSVGNPLCVSCDRTGSRPTGLLRPSDGTLLVDERGIWQGHWLSGSIPGWTATQLDRALYQSRYLSDSGRLYFDSTDALVSQDTNGLEDVYQYEPPGVPPGEYGCESPGGCVSLISSGASSEESTFLDASESAGDVFFLTAARLAPEDKDTSFDVYDAHECATDSPCPMAPVSPPPCITGDSCKPPPSPQPAIFGAPASATFSGTGNPVAPAKAAVTPKRLSAAQLLARALKACKQKPKKQRAACERQARKRYKPRKSKPKQSTPKKSEARKRSSAIGLTTGEGSKHDHHG
jgi:hypothetical protein